MTAHPRIVDELRKLATKPTTTPLVRSRWSDQDSTVEFRAIPGSGDPHESAALDEIERIEKMLAESYTSHRPMKRSFNGGQRTDMIVIKASSQEKEGWDPNHR